MKIGLHEIEWVRKHYPGLRVKNGNTIVGILRFRAKMKPRSKPPLLVPPVIQIWHESPCSTQGKHYLEDRFEIEGYFDGNSIPHFKETGGRLEARARKIGKPVIDLHVFPNTKELCLVHPVGISAIIKQDNSIRNFFEILLIPYLYYHSYWQIYGMEPWRGLKHGDAGILEGLVDFKYELDSRDSIELTYRYLSDKTRSEIAKCLKSGSEIKRNDMCFCGSGKKVKHCCGDLVMKGFNILLKAMFKEKKL